MLSHSPSTPQVGERTRREWRNLWAEIKTLTITITITTITITITTINSTISYKTPVTLNSEFWIGLHASPEQLNPVREQKDKRQKASKANYKMAEWQKTEHSTPDGMKLPNATEPEQN